MVVEPGAVLGRYEIEALIGRGGMGQVYRARDTRLRRDVAMKDLPAAFTADPERMARFEREAHLLASLNHPHIATTFQDAATVFADPLSRTFPDPDHSEGERRFVTIGASGSGALLVIAHTEKDDTIRMISARRVTRYERRFYEEEKG